MVEFNQEEAARGRAKTEALSAEEQRPATRRGSLELARTRAATDLARATGPAHTDHARAGDRGARRAAREALSRLGP